MAKKEGDDKKSSEEKKDSVKEFLKDDKPDKKESSRIRGILGSAKDTIASLSPVTIKVEVIRPKMKDSHFRNEKHGH